MYSSNTNFKFIVTGSYLKDCNKYIYVEKFQAQIMSLMIMTMKDLRTLECY